MNSSLIITNKRTIKTTKNVAPSRRCVNLKRRKTISQITTFAIAILLTFTNLNVIAQTAFELPFYEDWASGSFETNQWQTNGDYWDIDTQTGNPEPSARFFSINNLSNYSFELKSNSIDASQAGAEQIYFDFDLKLLDNTATATEKLLIQVFDGSSWHTVNTFKNTGSFDWTKQSFNITHWTEGKIIKLRFLAAGESSSNISDWYIDNIEVFRKCDIPVDLTGDNLGGDYNPRTKLIWHAPESAVAGSGWKHWDSGENHSGIGNGQEPIFVATRWDPGMLHPFDADTIESIRFFPCDDGFTYVIIKIWIGEEADSLIYADTAQNVVASEWNEHILNEDVIIDGQLEYWVGYEMFLYGTGVFPLGVDNGPAIVGYGDKLRYDGQTSWHNLSDFGPDFNVNWNIQMYVDTETTTNSDELDGFNVFKKEPDEDEYFQIDFVDYMDGQSIYTNIDICDGEAYTCDAFYKVNALWISDGDTCYSDFAPSLNNPEDNFVYVMFVDIEENEVEQSNLVVFPNPASNTLRLKSEEGINKVTIFNSLGQMVKSISPNGETELSIDVSNFKSGVYFLKVETVKGVVSKKFIKQ